MAAPIAIALAQAGLTLLADVVKHKGKEYVEKKFGVKIPDNPEELTPEKIEELKRFEIAYETDLMSVLLEGVKSISEYKKAEVEDRKSAREQEILIATSDKAPTLLKYTKTLLAFFLTFSLFLLIVILIFKPPSQNISELLYLIFGNLLGAFGTMIAYYFGTSESSSYKNEILKDIIKAAKERRG